MSGWFTAVFNFLLTMLYAVSMYAFAKVKDDEEFNVKKFVKTAVIGVFLYFLAYNFGWDMQQAETSAFYQIIVIIVDKLFNMFFNEDDDGATLNQLLSNIKKFIPFGKTETSIPEAHAYKTKVTIETKDILDFPKEFEAQMNWAMKWAYGRGGYGPSKQYGELGWLNVEAGRRTLTAEEERRRQTLWKLSKLAFDIRHRKVSSEEATERFEAIING